MTEREIPSAKAHVDNLAESGRLDPAIAALWEYLGGAEMPLVVGADGFGDERGEVHINFSFAELAAEMISYWAPSARPTLEVSERDRQQSARLNPEVAAGLRKLLEARDCFVRLASDWE